jgi:hypothetical protein
METNVQKPISDLERIQQSYTSGGQPYVPGKDGSFVPAKRTEGPQVSTHNSQHRTPSQG